MTREEAIKLVKRIKGAMVYTEEEKEALETLIPELCESESEDEKFRKYILRACKECVEANDRGLELSMSTTKKLLAYLEKQKEQKPELSKEDEKMIERLIRHTQKEFDELCNDRYGHQEIISDLKESCRERMNWLENRLKSLRPSWKPSEEQMKQLKSAADLSEFGPFVTSRKQFPALETLYEQLKKLV